MSAAGYAAYGKIPSLGDFFRIGSIPGVQEAWDVWLQGAMTAARAAIGPRWTDCYMSAPIWRFTLAPGILTRTAVLGIVMPSVDRVGRQYPLTILTVVPGASHAAALHLGAAPAFDALEAAALDMLEPGGSREALANRLRTLDLPRPRQEGAVRRTADGMLLGAGGAPAGVIAAGAVDRSYRRPCLFGTADGPRSRLACTEGLPPPSVQAALFDADAPLWPAGGAAP